MGGRGARFLEGAAIRDRLKDAARRVPGVLALHDRFFTAEAVTRRNTPRAYERLYRSPRLLEQYLNESRLRFYAEVAARVAERRPRSVLDAGAGTGHLLREVAARLPDAELVGVDRSRQAIVRGRESVPKARWIRSDLERLELPERFDAVLCTEVLEHVERPAAVVRHLLAHLAPGGRAIVTVPDGALDSWPGHASFWTEEELRSWLGPLGLLGVDRIDEGLTFIATLAAPDAY